MSKENRADPAELSIRLNIIKGLVVQGKLPRDIVDICNREHPEWGVTDRMIRYYVVTAKKNLAKSAPDIDLDEEFHKAKLRNDLLFATSFEAKDNKSALAANVENIKLMHLGSTSFKKSWREKFASAGIDPEDAMNQFVAILQAEAAKDNAES